MFGLSRRARTSVATLVVAVTAMTLGLAAPAQAEDFARISGAGSTWAQNAIDQWRRDVAGDPGVTVTYSGFGSTAARGAFIEGTVDFAVSELPFQRTPADGSAPETASGFTYLPALAGGTAFLYNLQIDGKRVTDLQLSGAVVAGIFSGAIVNWSDAAIQADNPTLVLPDRAITPVVRDDASGSSAQLTAWLSAEYPGVWTTGVASKFPVPANGRARSGSLGVAGYVSQAYGEGAITYVENSYALTTGFPVANLRNAAGDYVAPSAQNVSVALAGARVNDDPTSPDYLTQILDGVYGNPDARAYPLSSYAYLIAPTEVRGGFTADKGRALGAFARYLLCEGQQETTSLGYAPLPANLVAAGLTQLSRIPGADAASAGCADDSQGGEDSIELEATVLAPTDGPLSLNVPADATAVFGAPAMVDGNTVLTATLPRFSVTDARVVSRPGYTLLSSVTDFTSGTNSMPSSSLTVSPALAAEGSTATGVTPAAPFTASATGTTFAAAAAGEGIGETAFTAGLRLVAPAEAAPGMYRAKMTLTLVSR
ncbi:substrate-binding domain-containing protein [Microbacterium sp. P06]|uniref:substrate-binding domain-containing protein n=1 Tax=Microbacterium sp. P06 TaxID=3366949 RepID=UPI0037454A2D